VNLPADPTPQQGDTDAASVPETGDPTPGPAARTVDRRTLDEVFGEVLPETTSDERAERDNPGSRPGINDDWYYENRPPHHDR